MKINLFNLEINLTVKRIMATMGCLLITDIFIFRKEFNDFTFLEIIAASILSYLALEGKEEKSRRIYFPNISRR